MLQPRGWFWNGSTCEQIICTCYGDDCNSLFASADECLAAYPLCDSGDVCDPMDAEGVGPATPSSATPGPA
ncbi:MAG: hypothetical protein HC927_13320 [Deltaproteobacteria bacterium]|nr:hypothetical protein [Deltaproteobacteria bacterium]